MLRTQIFCYITNLSDTNQKNKKDNFVAGVCITYGRNEVHLVISVKIPIFIVYF